MPFYPESQKQIKERILANFPSAAPKEADLGLVDIGRANSDIDTQEVLANHLLWMLDRIEEMPGDEAGKRGRWMGYVFACLEFMGIATNADSRNMCRIDVRNGHT
ncbi:MAG TPA: hypothetical protein VD967_02385 [Candidatus Paceibacterota bacterium]|nr:hypothetical protein [Candidatus Paceibacterota bacterium]